MAGEVVTILIIGVPVTARLGVGRPGGSEMMKERERERTGKGKKMEERRSLGSLVRQHPPRHRPRCLFLRRP